MPLRRQSVLLLARGLKMGSLLKTQIIKTFPSFCAPQILGLDGFNAYKNVYKFYLKKIYQVLIQLHKNGEKSQKFMSTCFSRGKIAK